MLDSSPNQTTAAPSESATEETPRVFDEIEEIIEPPRRAYLVTALIALLGAISVKVAGLFGLNAFSIALVSVLGIPAIAILAKGARHEPDALTRNAARYALVASISAVLIAVWLPLTSTTVSLLFFETPTWLLSVGLLMGIASLTFLLWQRTRLPLIEAAHTVVLPRDARRIERGAAKLIPTSQLKRGNTVLITEGETVPVDGIILEGAGLVAEHALTAASTPVQKLPGMQLFAGSIIRSGRFLVTVHATGSETVLGQLQAQPTDTLTASERTNAQQSLHTIGSGGIVMASIIGGGTAVLLTPAFGLALGSAVLIASASGTLVASTRSARTITNAVAQTGARIRTADALLKLSLADTVVIEKTGVLTTGHVTVEHVVSFKPYTQQQVLNVAAAVEAHSDTRIGKAIVTFSRTMGAISLQRADDVVEEESAGVTGVVNGKEIVVGTVAYARRKKVRVPKDALGPADEGKTVLIVAQDKDAIGFLAIADATRDETASAMATILRTHTVVLLTSDHKLTAEANARAAGISSVVADVAPTKKGAEIAKLRGAGKHIALVTLTPRAEADVSIVLFDGRNPTPPIVGADIIVRSDDLSAVAGIFTALDVETRAIRRARTTARVVTSAGVIIAVGVPFLAWLPALVAGHDRRSRNT